MVGVTDPTGSWDLKLCTKKSGFNQSAFFYGLEIMTG
jgi:hypothetical protein